jgi:hypothetical protein
MNKNINDNLDKSLNKEGKIKGMGKKSEKNGILNKKGGLDGREGLGGSGKMKENIIEEF